MATTDSPSRTVRAPSESPTMGRLQRQVISTTTNRTRRWARKSPAWPGSKWVEPTETDMARNHRRHTTSLKVACGVTTTDLCSTSSITLIEQVGFKISHSSKSGQSSMMHINLISFVVSQCFHSVSNNYKITSIYLIRYLDTIGGGKIVSSTLEGESQQKLYWLFMTSSEGCPSSAKLPTATSDRW